MRTLAILFSITSLATSSAADFCSEWQDANDASWLGPDYWANPMEDWALRGRRIECLRTGANRNVHLLTQTPSAKDASFVTSVTIGRADGGKGAGSAGFRIGIKSDLGDYRSALLFGRGIDTGINSAGELFIGAKKAKIEDVLPASIRLTLESDGGKLQLVAKDTDADRELGRLEAKAADVSGNIALVNNHAGGKAKGAATKARYWFSDWKVSGEGIEAHPDRAFGPILFAHHSLTGGVMKMTAHLPPVGDKDSQEVALETASGDGWKEIGKDSLDPLARTAEFRHEKWDATADTRYRLKYRWRGKDHFFEGTVRKEPKGRPVVVAGFTGNTDPAFPNTTLAKNVGTHDPDLLVFTGDQLYEGVGGYGIHRTPVDTACLNYLRKWWLCGWAFRDLTRDRPALFFPDDHDVYQGNIWGQGGRRVNGMAEHAQGGYAMHKDFVNMVQRTQCSHHPDPHDATPVEQGITVYYGGFNYGGVSFAVVEDRKFKSGPEGKVNEWKGRPDHVKNLGYDVSKLDKPGLVLLGERQLEFLDAWAKDWDDTSIKIVLSQTIFCNLANYHGPGQAFIAADLDSNGWPQSGRKRALESMRRGFAFHMAGDQHLASIVHHGTETWGDSGYSFCVPSIAAGYPRSWRADAEGRPVQNRPAHGLPNTGEYKDGFGNKVTVHAIANPAKQNRKGRLETLHDKASGYGILRLDPEQQTITMECWRLLFDAANAKPGDQFPGWPKTISVGDNYAREAKAWLPTIKVEGATDPIVHVETAAGEHVYSRRLKGDTFSLKVFAKGAYQITIEAAGSKKTVTAQANEKPAENAELVVDFTK